MSDTQKKVIIVGGGPAGFNTAKYFQKRNLKKEVEVVIVDRQDYMDWSLASPRGAVAPDDVERYGYCFPQEALSKFVGASFVQGAVASVTSGGAVTLEDGTVLQGDAVVICIGGQYASGALWKPLPDQITKEKRIAAFRAEYDKISKASDIVIAGAGASGVEVAGEIKDVFPDNNVTLVGSVMTSASPFMQTKVKATLEQMGVVFKEGRVEAMEPSDGQVVTTKGETIKCDLLLNTAGFAYAGKALVDGDATLKDSVTERGQFICKPTLQLKTCDTIFACGDIVQVPEGKYADVKGLKHAEETGHAVADNVYQLLCSTSNPKLKDFPWSSKPVIKPMMTALGTKHAVGDLMMGLGSTMARSIKCKDYYMSVMGKAYGKGKTW